jgi:hypothetical protein
MLKVRKMEKSTIFRVPCRPVSSSSQLLVTSMVETKKRTKLSKLFETFLKTSSELIYNNILLKTLKIEIYFNNIFNDFNFHGL